MSSVRSSAAAREAAKLMAVVVLPTPPFWLATAIIRAIQCSPGLVGRARVVAEGGGYKAQKQGSHGGGVWMFYVEQREGYATSRVSVPRGTWKSGTRELEAG